MGELIEGFDKSVNDEYARLRGEIAIAITESGYTLEQVAALAGVSRRTLHNLLTGASSVGTDTLIRVAFIVGGRLEVARSEGEEQRPFQVVPSAQSAGGRLEEKRSSSNPRSSSSRKAAHLSQAGRGKTNKTAAEKGKRSTRRKRETSCSSRSAVRPARSGRNFAAIGPNRLPCSRTRANERVRQTSIRPDDFVSVAEAA